MPAVAVIDGVKIEFYFDDHPPPHFHARYAEFIAKIHIETLEIMKGSLPRPQLRTVRDWAETRRGALLNAWGACGAGVVPERIS
jgi:Domain of unknown function (DUF4160)